MQRQGPWVPHPLGLLAQAVQLTGAEPTDTALLQQRTEGSAQLQ